MNKKNRPNFRLQRINSDGHAEEPILYSIEAIDGKWKMGRRGFLAASFALAGFITGCASVQQKQAPGKDNPSGNLNLSPGTNTGSTTGKGESVPTATKDQPPMTVTGFCNKDVTAHRLKVQALLFTKDGKHLLSGGMGDTLKFWKFPAGKQIRKISNIPIKSMDLGGADEALIATADSAAEGILLYDAGSGKKLQNLKESAFDYVNCVAFDPKGTYLAAGRADSKITVWNLLERRRKYHLKQHTREVTSVAFSPDGRYMASGAKGEILLWSAESWRLLHKIRVGKISIVNQLNFSPNSRLLAVGATYDSAVRIFSVPSGKGYTYLKGHDYNRNKVFAFSPDGEFIATGALSNRIYIWKTATGKPCLILEGQRMHDSVQSLAFSPDGQYLVSGGEDSIKIWMMPEGELLTCLFDPSTMAVNIKVNQYTMRDQFGQVITFTLPCGSPLPPGAVCTCNCIPGTWKFDYGKPAVRSKTTPRSRSYCSCNQVCTCVPVMY